MSSGRLPTVPPAMTRGFRLLRSTAPSHDGARTGSPAGDGPARRSATTHRRCRVTPVATGCRRAGRSDARRATRRPCGEDTVLEAQRQPVGPGHPDRRPVRRMNGHVDAGGAIRVRHDETAQVPTEPEVLEIVRHRDRELRATRPLGLDDPRLTDAAVAVEGDPHRASLEVDEELTQWRSQ